jgi:kinesin family protein 3/17
MEAAGESLSTLKFAQRAKAITNRPVVNEDVDSRTLLRRYELELGKLRQEVAQKQQEEGPKRLEVLAMEARQAEQDKLEALRQVDKLSYHCLNMVCCVWY